MLKEIFETASINRIAIIDDDLSTDVSLDDIRSSNEDVVSILGDSDDPDTDKFIKLLKELGINNSTLEDLVEALGREDIRDKVPEKFRDVVNNILSDRQGRAAPINKLCSWLKDEGVDTDSFHIFTSPEIDTDEMFDLVLVDYFLVGDDKEQTLPLITQLLDKHDGQPNPLLVILMSSHEDQLKADFFSLRPELQITSSRFRVMKKPMEQSEEEQIQWMLTLQQLAQERKVVLSVESFLKEWGNKMKVASAKLADGLWELDAHSLEKLRQAAEDDHALFEDYLTQILSKKILAEVEESGFPIDETKELSEILSSEKETLSYGTEICDSRQALRELLGDISWKRPSSWETDVIPETDEDKFNWIKKNIQFGCVLKDESGKLFVHVTQSCDLAHLTYQNRVKQHLLLFPGELVKTDRRFNSDKEHSSEAYFHEDEWNNIYWQLTRPRTISFDSLIQDLDKYSVVGQLREDQTQGIINNYAARSARVAGIRVPSFSALAGKIISVQKNAKNYELVLKENSSVEGTLYNKKFINFDLKTALIIVNIIDAVPNKKDSVTQLVRGFNERESICGQKVMCLLVPSDVSEGEEMQWLHDQKPCNSFDKLKTIFENKQNLIILRRN